MSAVGKIILIAGGSGFIGTALGARLAAAGWRVRVVSRSPRRGDITWDELGRHGLPACDAVVNLAGKHILDPRRRWTRRYREEVIRSRVEATRTLVRLIEQSAAPPAAFLTVSGKCFYGTSRTASFDESAPPGTDFPGALCERWEREARGLGRRDVRHVQIRTAIALGEMYGDLRNNGILPYLRIAFELGLGSYFVTGRQVFPWVHIDDVTAIIESALESPDWHGVYNAVAPVRQSNHDFMLALAHCLERPLRFRLPARLVRALIGVDRSPILLEGQHVLPRRTVAAGYRFRYTDLDEALRSLASARECDGRRAPARRPRPDACRPPRPVEYLIH